MPVYQGSFPTPTIPGGLAAPGPRAPTKPQTLPPWIKPDGSMDQSWQPHGGLPAYGQPGGQEIGSPGIGIPQIGAPPGGQQGVFGLPRPDGTPEEQMSPPMAGYGHPSSGHRGGIMDLLGGGQPPIAGGQPAGPTGGGNTLQNLFNLLGLGNEGVSGSSRTTVGDVSQETGDTLSPLLAALQSIFGTQTGADVSFGSQAIQKLLGQEQNANNRFATQTQQQIADNANKEAARAQAAQFAENQVRAQSNLDRFNSIAGNSPRNPLLRAPRTSGNVANSLMQSGTMPPMMA